MPYFLSFPARSACGWAPPWRGAGQPLRPGVRRLLLCNGHGRNGFAGTLAIDWKADHPDASVKFHNWWNAPQTFAKVQAIDPVASHASWMENFPWTRLEGVVLPREQKPMVDVDRMRAAPPAGVRALLGDGTFAGSTEKPDDMLALWAVAVAETRAVPKGPWA
jgi:creatinine amidohydrolase